MRYQNQFLSGFVDREPRSEIYDPDVSIPAFFDQKNNRTGFIDRYYNGQMESEFKDYKGFISRLLFSSKEDVHDKGNEGNELL